MGAMAAAVTEEQKTSSIMHIETYIRTLVSLGIWDDKLSLACLELARLHFEASAFYQEQLEYRAFNTLYTTKRKASKLECLRLANDHESRDEYREAMHIAQSGLLVEQHFYLKCHYGELSRICADCFLEDTNLQAAYRETERAARIFLD
ncbi:hypothetical protein J4E80_001056 [Alternaria sp. BMP 0032]|nr:hypothetical protein J4E80_001056 [Alternaria sp. BMP 0032]